MNVVSESLKNNPETTNFYDGYNYLDFWIGRQYEDSADKMAVSRLLSLIPGTVGRLIDVGSGIGRMVPLYDKKCKECVLLDSSVKQLKEAQRLISPSCEVSTVIGSGDAIPFPDSSFNAALCVRMFHHIADPAKVIKEINRVLETDGYFILEIPNKLHFKNLILSLFKRKHKNIFSEMTIDHSKSDDDIDFLNHNPKTISKVLESNGFKILETLSVSNFRSPFLKDVIPTTVLVYLERLVQKPFSHILFGPSIYFLARKIPSKDSN